MKNHFLNSSVALLPQPINNPFIFNTAFIVFNKYFFVRSIICP